MSVTRIASRYAKSLVDLAQETGNLDAVWEDFRTLNQLLKNRDFSMLLRSPVVPDAKKTKVVRQLLEDRVEPLTMKFMLLLVKKDREVYMPEIIREFTNQYKAIRNIHTITVTSASRLSDESVEAIRDKIREITGLVGGTIELVEKVDPSLIGGFVLEYKGLIYDSSVTRRLFEVRKNYFKENLYKPKVISR